MRECQDNDVVRVEDRENQSERPTEDSRTASPRTLGVARKGFGRFGDLLDFLLGESDELESFGRRALFSVPVTCPKKLMERVDVENDVHLFE